MKRKSQPVPPEKADKNVITVVVPRNCGRRDNVVNRHGGAFADKTKVKSKRACRGRSSSRNDGDFNWTRENFAGSEK